MSFLISATRLFGLTQSPRLRRVIEGKFSVQVLSSPTTTPYYCDLSSETIRATLDAVLANTEYGDEDREEFVEWLVERLGVSDVVRQKPTVHAELAMIMAMVKDEIKDVLPYIGVSKLSCIMCSHYIRAFNEVTRRGIATKGSHGKAYPGWFWPNHPDPDRDGELRRAFLGHNREQLLDGLEEHKTRRSSDSTVGSGGPEWEDIGNREEILKMGDDLRKG
jgi:OTT_1508-like deaminase